MDIAGKKHKAEKRQRCIVNPSFKAYLHLYAQPENNAPLVFFPGK